jgi:hypothetical protein
MATNGDKKLRKGGSRIDGDIADQIMRLARDNWTPAQIYRELERLQREEGRFKGRALPVLRTVERYVAKILPPEAGARWSMADADPEDAALVLPVLGEAILQSKGHWRRFGVELARWIIKVRRAAPDIPPLWALYVAEAYRANEQLDEALESLDQMLALAPWRPGRLPAYLLFATKLLGERFEGDTGEGLATRAANALLQQVPRSCGLSIALHLRGAEVPEWPNLEALREEATDEQTRE